MNDERQILTVREAAEIWRIKDSWIYQNIRDIPHFRIGHQLRFDADELRRFFRRRAEIENGRRTGE